MRRSDLSVTLDRLPSCLSAMSCRGRESVDCTQRAGQFALAKPMRNIAADLFNPGGAITNCASDEGLARSLQDHELPGY